MSSSLSGTSIIPSVSEVDGLNRSGVDGKILIDFEEGIDPENPGADIRPCRSTLFHPIFDECIQTAEYLTH